MSERYERGRELLARWLGEQPATLLEESGAVSEDFSRYVVELAYGDVFQRPGLEQRDRVISGLSCLVASGGLDRQVELHVRAALNLGLTKDEVVEVLINCLPYCGLQRVQNALLAAKRAFDEPA